MPARRFWVAFVAAVIMTTGATAYAKWRRISPYSCMGDGGGAISLLNSSGVANLGSSTGFLRCPIVDDDLFPKNEISILNVHVFDNETSGAVYSRACKVEYSGLLSCGAYDSSGNGYTGFDVLNPPISSWSSVSGMAYVEVQVPPKLAATPSYLVGLYVQSP